MKSLLRSLLLLLGIAIAGGIFYTTPSNWLSADDDHPSCVPIPYSPVTENLFLLKENFHTVDPEGSLFPLTNPDSFSALTDAVKFGNKYKDVDELCDVAMAGDFDSMAGLALVGRLEAAGKLKAQANAPALVWEDWLIRLLGEKEGNYIVGVVASILVERLPTRKDEERELSAALSRAAVDALQRAGRAGHAEALYGLALFAGSSTDSGLRMVGNSPFSTATQAMQGASFTPEMLDWMGKAAVNGSSRANLRMGLSFMDAKNPTPQNSTAALDFLKKSASQGNAVAASALVRILDPRSAENSVPNASCAQSMHYFALAERMRDQNGTLWRERPARIGPDESSYLDTLFTQMNQGQAGFEQCLTEEEYRAILAETKTEHSAIRAELEARKRERDTLYEQARARLPELRDAYEKAKKQF